MGEREKGRRMACCKKNQNKTRDIMMCKSETHGCYNNSNKELQHILDNIKDVRRKVCKIKKYIGKTKRIRMTRKKNKLNVLTDG